MCEYCENKFLNKSISIESIPYQFSRRVVVEPNEEGKLMLKYQEVTDDEDWIDGTILETEINFCPMCGKDLTKKES